MKEPLSTAWDKMDDRTRWSLLDSTDLRGLQKCQIALMPFLKIKREWRDKIEDVYNK